MTDSYSMMIRRNGGPEVLERVATDLPAPAADELRIRQTHVGLNFVDIYHRSGQFGAHGSLDLPAVLGVQGAGVVEAGGSSVTDMPPGTRVAYTSIPGAYTSHRNIRRARLIPLPDDISEELAAASLVRGLTAEYLIRRLYPVKPGDAILVHAAAGGVGMILCQWARALGAKVIGTVSTPEKAELARSYGCEHPLLYKSTDWVAEVLDLTGGKGVHVVYDGIGADTFVPSLGCLRIRGMAVNFGTTSGQVPAFPLQLLHSKSLSVCRPTLPNFIDDPDEYSAAAQAFFALIRDGVVQIERGPSYALTDVAQAHDDFENRRFTGLPVLVV